MCVISQYQYGHFLLPHPKYNYFNYLSKYKMCISLNFKTLILENSIYSILYIFVVFYMTKYSFIVC